MSFNYQNHLKTMTDYFKKLLEIRKRYEEIGFLINGKEFRLCPYDIYDWDKIWTPIERNTWDAIRYLGLPFYPQYPVGNYFIDFADPFKKIGIEIDGRKFHQDFERDEYRQSKLENMGWEIFRIPGWMTFKNREDYLRRLEENEDCYDEYGELNEKWRSANNKYRNETAEGKLFSIKEDYYLRKKYYFII